MSFFSRIKEFFTGGGSSSRYSSSRRSSSQYSYRGNSPRATRTYVGGSSSSYSSSGRDKAEDERERQRREREERTKALASIGNQDKLTQLTGKTGQERALETMRKKSEQNLEKPKVKATDPKETARIKAREKALKRLDSITNNKEYSKATGGKYDISKNGLKARQAMKSGEYQSDVKAQKYAVDHHQKAESFARGLTNAATFGGSDLLAKYGTKGKAKEAEEYYQKNKSKGAEVVGELAGSLASFGLTGGASYKAVGSGAKKLAPKAVERGTEKAVAKFAASKAVKNAARKEAVKRFGENVSEEAIEQIAKRRAKNIVAELGKDAATNVTTGLVYDVNSSIRDSKDGKDFAKNMAQNAAMNLLLGGATSIIPELRVGKNLDGLDNALRNADEAVGEGAKKRKPVRKELRAYTKWENKAKTHSNIGELAENGVKSTDDVVKTIEPSKAIERKVEPPKKTEIVSKPKQLSPELEEIREKTLRGEPITKKDRKLLDRELKKASKLQRKASEADLAEISRLGEEAEARRAEGLAKPKTRTENPEIRFATTPSENDIVQALAETKRRVGQGKNANVIDVLKENHLSTDDFHYSKEQAEVWNKKADELLAKEGADSVKAEPPRPKDFDNAGYISSSDEGARELVQEQLGVKKGITESIEDIPGVEPTREDKMLEHLSNEYANGDYLSPEMGKTESRQGFPTLGVDMTRKDIARATGEVIESKPVATAEQRLSELKDYYKSHANESADELRSRAVSSYLNIASSDQSVKILQDMSKNGIFNYKPVHMKELVEKAGKYFENADNVREFNSRVSKILDSTNHNKDAGLSVHEAPEFLTKLHYQMQMLEPHLESNPELMNLYQQDASLMQDILTSMGQTGAIQRHYVHLTPQGKVRDTTELYARMLDECAGFRLDYKDQLPSGYHERINWIKDLLLGDEEYSSLMKDILDNNGNEEALNLARMSAGDLINSKYATKSGLDLLQQWRISSMLTLPRTWIKNIENNAAAMPLDITAEAISNALEKHILKSKGFKEGEVALHSGFSLKAFLQSIASNPTDADAKRAKETFNNLYKDVLGADKYAAGKKYKGRNIRGKVGKMWAVQRLNAGVNAWSDFISNVLSKGDLIFKEQIYRENYTKLCKRYRELGMTMDDAMYNRIDQEAFERALRNTYNNANNFAQMWNEAARNFTNPDATISERAVGFAATTLNPFAKVSSNLAVRSFEYSPAGLVRSVINIEKAAKKGDALLIHQAITQMGKGIAGGVGLFGLGMFSATVSDNLLVGDISSSDPADKFMRQQGLQSYSAVLPVNGNKYSFSLTDVSPDSGVFFMGYKFCQSLMEKNINVFEAGFDWAQLATLIMEPTLNSSVFTATNSLLQTLRGNYGDDGDKSSWEILGRELVQSYKNSLIPAFIPALAKTMYKADKQLVGGGGSDEEYFENQLKIKTGLAGDNPVTRALGIEPLGADTDAYGNYKNEKNSAGDYAHSFVKNFLAPSTWQKTSMADSDYAKVDKSRELVKNGVDPSKADYMFPKKQTKNTFEIGDETVKMSPKEISLYNHAKTTGGSEAMRAVLESPAFNHQKVTTVGNKKTYSVVDGYTKEQKQQLIDQFKGKSMRDVEQWLEKQPQWQKATDDEKQKTLSELWTITKGLGDSPAKGAKRVGEQEVFKSRGRDVSEYNFINEVSDSAKTKLMPLIKNKTVSYEDAVNFFRESANTTYKEDGTHNSTNRSGKTILAALEASDLDESQKKALFEALYTGKSSYEQYKATGGKRGSGRRGYRHRSGYRRKGSSKKSSKAKTPVKPTAIKGFTEGKALVAKSYSTSTKSTLPKLKRVEAKIDLPTPKK